MFHCLSIQHDTTLTHSEMISTNTQIKTNVCIGKCKCTNICLGLGHVCMCVCTGTCTKINAMCQCPCQCKCSCPCTCIDSYFDSDTDSDTDINKQTIVYHKIKGYYKKEEGDYEEDRETNEELREDMSNFINCLPYKTFSSVNAYRAFITFFTDQFNVRDEEYTTKIMFHLACESYIDLGKFMLENGLYSENILTSWDEGFPIQRMFCSEKNYELFEYWVRYVPDLQKVLCAQTQSTQRTCLFSPSILTKQFIQSEHCTDTLLKIIDYKGNNFFHYTVIFENIYKVNMLLKENKITRDIILQPNNQGLNAFQHSILHSVLKELFESIVKSGKLLDEDFETDVNGNPLYFSIFDSFEKGKHLMVTTFLDSQYCTETRVEKYLAHNNLKTLRDVIFAHPRFASLKKAYCDKKSETNTHVKMVELDNQILKIETDKLKLEIDKLKLENQMLKDAH